MRGTVIGGIVAAALVLACGTPAPAGAPGAGGPAAPATDPAAPASGASSGVAACDLLTDAEIKEETGYGVETKESAPQLGIYENGCRWVLDNTPVPWEIVLGVRVPGGRAYYDTYLAAQAGDPVPGLGDVAVEGPAKSIIAVKGDALVDLQYVSFEEGDEEVRRELVRLILARL